MCKKFSFICPNSESGTTDHMLKIMNTFNKRNLKNSQSVLKAILVILTDHPADKFSLILYKLIIVKPEAYIFEGK